MIRTANKLPISNYRNTNRIGKTARERVKSLPWLLLFLILAVTTIGLFILYSAADNHFYPWCYKQLINLAIFLPIAILIALIDLRYIFKLSYILYFIALLLLIAVEFYGTTTMGAKRWINLGIKLQPSELIKPAIVLMLARYCHQLEEFKIDSPLFLLPAILFIIVPTALVIKQPDLGTGVIIIIVSTIILFISGVKTRKFIGVFILICVSLPIIWQLMYDYQKRRIAIFLDPSKDPLGSGYNIIQSKIAIGSGGLVGKGFTLGTQSHLDFLPEHQTDFIFAALAEELGFIGSSILIILYGIITIYCLSIAANSKSVFAKLMTTGITSIFWCHIVVNIAMVMGLLPVVGVPLPLISYGGTMMGSMIIGFGLIMNAHIHKRNNNF